MLLAVGLVPWCDWSYTEGMSPRVKHAPKIKKGEQPVAQTLFNYEKVSDAIVGQAARILGPLDGQRILICAGKGGTGAAGLAAAPKLLQEGVRLSILLAQQPDDCIEDGRLFLKQAETLRVPIRQWSQNLPEGTYRQDLLIDALLGAHTDGAPRFPLDQIIVSMNDSRTPVLCLDVPSGLDPQTGKPGKPTVVGMVTLQVSVSTKKLLDKAGALYVGKVVPVSQ